MTVIGFYILNKPADSMGLLSILISTTAMIFNVIFNWVFDKLFPFVNGDRPIKLRVLHAAGFECMMILFTLPMISYLLKVTFLEAFMIELGFLVFFLFYTYLYNWAYDQIRKKVVAHYAQKHPHFAE